LFSEKIEAFFACLLEMWRCDVFTETYGSTEIQQIRPKQNIRP